MRRPAQITLLGLLALTGSCAESADPPAAADPAAADPAGEGPGLDSLCDATASLFALPKEATDATSGAVVDALVTHAPAEVADDVTTLLGLGATADGLGAYTDPAYVAADAAVTEAVLADCDQTPLQVEASDFAFAGLPTELDTGRVVIELINTSSQELHELSLLRKNDDVDASFEELFELPDDEATASVSPYGTTIVGPEATTVLVTDLPPGEYLAACFLPVGSLADGDADPHVARGMFQTFTVSS